LIGHAARSALSQEVDILKMVHPNPLSRAGVSSLAELIVFACAVFRFSRGFFGRNWNQGKALVRIFCGVMWVCHLRKLIPEGLANYMVYE
jgi:hypothetical protein